ncbi:cupin domain-containing protein [Cellulomonas sp. S1-8]|uniref:cupin domain-containing protein n=1 Tax=Cellulomonas sp. S1-8 TaxID=2904790 RepID=UPI002243F225|nr:cupin domain-containing protein [Cellulomonas sp. S1-8]UZN01566.1 cupin domain-containing protein [Cellulomonas sp. S1-8]
MSARPDQHAEFTTAPRRSKPWGHETVFAGGEHGYVGKLIAVDAGQALSLQYHVEKDETISIVSGEAVVEYGTSEALLQSRTMQPGDVVHVPAAVLHRLTAVTDLLFAEASTAAPGWQEDVVRVSDRYGRAGTTAV